MSKVDPIPFAEHQHRIIAGVMSERAGGQTREGLAFGTRRQEERRLSFFVLAQPSSLRAEGNDKNASASGSLGIWPAGLLALGLQVHSSNDGLRYHGGYRCRKERRQRRYDEQESDSPPLFRQEGSSCRRIEPTSTTTPNKMCNAEQHGTCRTNNDAPDAGTAERAAAVAAAEGDAAYAAISDYESEDSAFSSFSRG